MAENSSKQELGPIAKMLHRTEGFYDTAGCKDPAGNGINLTLLDGKLFSPLGEKYIQQVKTANVRPDDVLLCGYPKTGCHWSWEILYMILQGKAENSPIGKGQAFLEMVDLTLCDGLPSPRALNTHMEYQDLPTQAKELKTKILFTTRNPKDTAVSLYHHHVNLTEMYNYRGDFTNWFHLFLEGKVDNGSYFDFHASWDRAIKAHPDHPVLIVNYEETIKDPHAVIKRMAKFFEVELDDVIVQEIAKATAFSNMKKQFLAKGVATHEILRKGKTGGWRDQLTVAQSEAVDNLVHSKLKDTVFARPIYTV